MNQIAEFAFMIAGASLVLFLLLRPRHLDPAQRNAVAAGFFGLQLCGRFAAVIDGVGNWIFVVACAGMFTILALNNLGLEKRRAS